VPAFRLHAAVCLALCAWASTGAAEEVKKADAAERCFLWRATSDSNTVYLLGSVHVGTDEFYPLPKEIQDAFAAAKYLVVESDPEKTPLATRQKLATENCTYKDEDRLSQHLSKETLELYDAHAAKNGLPAASEQKTRAWMLAGAILNAEAQKLGYKNERGIDRYFLGEARGKKEIIGLETTEALINMLSSFPDELDDLRLRIAIAELGELKEHLARAVGAWKNGDTKTLEEELTTKPLARHPELAAVFVKLRDERNVRMAEKIDGYLKEKDGYFVVVGAAHLIGEKSVLKLLENKNYKIAQIRRTDSAKQDAPEKTTNTP